MVKDVRTTKPISTISFNTSDFLAGKLNELLKAKRISFWAFITHKPEDDEAGKKVHHHVYIQPSKMLQTDDLREELKEFDPVNPDKPLGCLMFKSSKFDSWYMYGLHDKRYLASKGQSRKFHYTDQDFVSSDSDDLLFNVRNIDLLSLSPYADMESAIEAGYTWPQYFARGTVPIPQVSVFERAWYTLVANMTDRNGYVSHENLDENNNLVDAETGEIIGDLND